MAINSIKTLTLMLDTDQVECQLTTAQLVDEPEGAETLTTFCGAEDVSGTPKYTLNISGFQDYGHTSGVAPGTPDSVFDMLHTAYITDAEIDAVLTVGSSTRSFACKPQNDTPFGGDAGAAMTGDIALAVVGAITDGTVP
jgi:hypothetical protein